MHIVRHGWSCVLGRGWQRGDTDQAEKLIDIHLMAPARVFKLVI